VPYYAYRTHSDGDIENIKKRRYQMFEWSTTANWVAGDCRIFHVYHDTVTL